MSADVGIRPFQAPPRDLPNVVPRFFVGDDGKAYVQLSFPRNPHSMPIMAVTSQIAAEHPDKWAAFVAEQEAPEAEKESANADG